MGFIRERGIAPCGLACAACSAQDCAGCANDETKTCDSKRCNAEKGTPGCWACVDAACSEGKNVRVRAFLRYAREKGTEALLDALERNESAGIHYHRQEGIQGDYDDLQTIEDILLLLETGSYPDPYARCPSFTSEHLQLKKVRMEDAQALLECYSDPVTQRHADSTNCAFGFAYEELDEMEKCISSWLREYDQRRYIRWTIRDRQADKPIGTVEYFCSKGDTRVTDEPVDLGVLRLDLKSEYETEELFGELLDIAIEKMARHLGVSFTIAKVEEDDAPRMAAYAKRGFKRLTHRPFWRFTVALAHSL